MTEIEISLKSFDITPNKALGQNFLADDSVAARIAQAASMQGEYVLEIGAGLGSLTKHICRGAKAVTAIELDARLAAAAERIFCEESNVTIVRGDFMRIDPLSILPEPTVAAANLPYYITTPICERLIERYTGLKRMVLMAQKEAACRFFAHPGDRVYGVLSVLSRIYFEPSELLSVNRSAYYPEPTVDSSVTLFERRCEAFSYHRELCAFIRAAFSMRRKTLVNNLSSYRKDVVKAALDLVGLSDDVRAEAIEPDKFVELFLALSAKTL